MATFIRFEDIEAWQKARQSTQVIYTITNPDKFGRDFSLKDQIRRASISIMSNIAEGFERESIKEFSHFLSIAKGSAGEVESQLYIAFDQNYITKQQFDDIFKISLRQQNMLHYEC